MIWKITLACMYVCFDRYPADIQRGVVLLEELYKRPEEIGKRDYVFYLAIGNARLKVRYLYIGLFILLQKGIL